MDDRSRRRAWQAVIMVALAVRLVACFWWQNQQPPERPFAFPDSETYWELAGRWARTGEFWYDYHGTHAAIFRTPGYPALLAPMFLIWGIDPPVLAARLLSALLGTAAVAAAMFAARTIFNDDAALITGLALALDPGTITTGVFVLSEAPFCPLMMLHLFAWWKAWKASARRDSLGWSLGGGVMAGLATLMRPSWLLFTPLAAVVLMGVGPDRRRQMQIALVMLAGLCATMSPWWVRNYVVAGRFVPTTLQVGASLYDGLNPQADGGSEMSFVAPFVFEQQQDDEQMPQPVGTFEDRLDRRMRDTAIVWAKDHPTDVARLAVVKFLRMWNPSPNAKDLGSVTSRTAVAVGYVPILLSAAWGAWKLLPRDRILMLLILPAVYFTLLHVIFVAAIRYRLPAMLPLAILGAGAWSEWMALANRSRKGVLK